MVSILLYSLVSISRRFLGVLRHIKVSHLYFIVDMVYCLLFNVFSMVAYTRMRMRNFYIFLITIFLYKKIVMLKKYNLILHGYEFRWICRNRVCFYSDFGFGFGLGTQQKNGTKPNFVQGSDVLLARFANDGHSNRSSSPSLFSFLCHSLFSK